MAVELEKHYPMKCVMLQHWITSEDVAILLLTIGSCLIAAFFENVREGRQEIPDII